MIDDFGEVGGIMCVIGVFWGEGLSVWQTPAAIGGADNSEVLYGK